MQTSYDFHFTTPSESSARSRLLPQATMARTPAPMAPSTQTLRPMCSELAAPHSSRIMARTLPRPPGHGYERRAEPLRIEALVPVGASHSRTIVMMPDVALDADLNTGVNVYQAAANGRQLDQWWRNEPQHAGLGAASSPSPIRSVTPPGRCRSATRLPTCTRSALRTSTTSRPAAMQITRPKPAMTL